MPKDEHPFYLHTLRANETPALQPAAELNDKVSRWSHGVPHPPLPIPQQRLESIQPPRPISEQTGVLQKSPLHVHQVVPEPARHPVPEPNPLQRNEVLDSSVTILQAPPRRDRRWDQRSTRPILRSACLLSQVTLPQQPLPIVPHMVNSVPIVNSMKRRHDVSSPMVNTSPEDCLDTPADDAVMLLLRQGGSKLPGSTDWVDDFAPINIGNARSKSQQTRTPPQSERVLFDKTRIKKAATALVRIYEDPKTRYTNPAQAMLALTLISAIPPDNDPVYILTPTSDPYPTRVIDNLVERFTMGIYSAARDAKAKGQPIPIGSVQMLWELHFVSLQRWGPESLLAGHTEVLADLLDRDQ